VTKRDPSETLSIVLFFPSVSPSQLIEERVGNGQMLFHSFSSHAIDLMDHHLHSRIFLKEISVMIDKPPVKTIPYATPFAFRKTVGGEK